MVSVGSELGLWHNMATTKKAIFARFGEHEAHIEAAGRAAYRRAAT